MNLIDTFYNKVFQRYKQIFVVANSMFSDRNLKMKRIDFHVTLHLFCTGFADTKDFTDSGIVKYTALGLSKYKIKIPEEKVARRKKLNEVLSQSRADYILSITLDKLNQCYLKMPLDSIEFKNGFEKKSAKAIGLGEEYPDEFMISTYQTKENKINRNGIKGDDPMRRKTFLQVVFDIHKKLE